MIGFHTYEYCSNFLDCCRKLPDCDVERNTMKVYYHGRVVLVRAIPAGISYTTICSNSFGELSEVIQI